MEQDGRLIALSIGAFSKQRIAALEYDERPAPVVPPPEEVPVAPRHPRMPPFSHQWEFRYAVGKPPFTGDPAGPTLSGGWIKPTDDHPIDAALVAQITDAWLPAVFIRLTEPNAVPTIDLTIHFRADLPLPPDYVLVKFESRLSSGGFVEEDGWIWSRDGHLIAHSRQLALLQQPTQD
jgi:acyl-CoA thioesterase